MPPHDLLAPFVDGSTRRARFAVQPAAPPVLEPVDGLLAGVAEVDITPPPGLPKAGYSANAHDGAGFRTRLRARVLHLRAGRVSLAVVACDLLGGSAVVQHLVARAVAQTTDVPLAGLMIGATHTHAGPGQFLGTDFYNRFASNRSGFDPAWTSFLVERIAGGVEQAVATRAPARLAVGSADVWGLTRNRSIDPHVRNPEVADRRTDPHRRYVNVNPRLHMVRVDAADAPLGALIVFSVHGTGVSVDATEYNADLWAYLVGEAGDRIAAATGTRPVLGAVEGTHADVAPALRPGMAGHVEARRVGRAIGAAAADLHAALAPDLTADVSLGAALREVDLDRDRTVAGTTLPDRPAVGASLVAGAFENTTPVVHRIPPFKAGTPKRWGADGPQGAKWVIGSRWLQPVVLPKRVFPRVLPVQVLRLGPAALVGIPFEVTVGSGRVIADAVRPALADEGVTDIVVSSVANEYSGYVATPDEYALQHYEGGHTLYGPLTLPFLAAQAGRLATELASSPDDVVADVRAERAFDLRVTRYLPAATGASTVVAVDGPARFTDTTARVDAFWELAWSGPPPGDLTWHEPMARVEAQDGDGPWGPAADDQGWDVAVLAVGADEGDPTRHRYVARWYLPDLRAGRRHRFVIGDVPSEPFD
ncbi:MAG TPA: neutral/alkaline non-lysosomal ceramidase N-terminal domain-containing protein [Iamia sp.]|nr:neutral/alkaline non-lysosomal ceramidase N-terminal domain-containing protein [Iamia sp.]